MTNDCVHQGVNVKGRVYRREKKTTKFFFIVFYSTVMASAPSFKTVTVHLSVNCFSSQDAENWLWSNHSQ